MRTSTMNPVAGRLAGLLALLAASSAVWAGEFDKYVWETPRVVGIDQAKTAAMAEILAQEVQKILDAGPLAPLRTAYADIPREAYFSYFERGRIITTLAYAYPHVTGAQQEGIRKYVQNLLKDPEQAPWTQGILGRDQGASRTLSGVRVTEGDYLKYAPKSTPTVHVLYGLWLYGHRTGDWGTLKDCWPQIKQYYARCVSQETFLYGQMSAHVAIARLAKRFDDTQMQQAAVQALEKDLVAGQDTAGIEQRQKQTRFGKYYDKRNVGYFAGQPWMFLDASPEILRFIAESAKDQAVQRIGAIQTRYPLWWLHQAPYFTRWTGDEGVGIPPDLLGICYPIERWVKGTPPDTLAGYMRSAPTGIGDCYWLESLVQTIEAFGTTKWEPLDLAGRSMN